MSRIVGSFVNPVVGAVDVDAVLEQVDVEELVDRIDIQHVIDRVDINALIARIDPNPLLARLDLDELLKRVDLNEILERLDVEALMARVDVNSILEQVDIADVVHRVQVGSVVVDSAGSIALSAVDLVRKTLADADTLTCYAMRRLFRRGVMTQLTPTGDLTGCSAGPFTRLVAFVLDLLAVAGLFSLATLMFSYLVGLFTGHTVSPVHHGNGPWWTVAAVVFGIAYFWAGIALAGRTFGKALLGMRVLGLDGGSVRGRSALVRILVLPFSLVLGLGCIPIVLGGDRRALHDYGARTREIYDWSGRTPMVSAGLARRLAPPGSPKPRAPGGTAAPGAAPKNRSGRDPVWAETGLDGPGPMPVVSSNGGGVVPGAVAGGPAGDPLARRGSP